MDTPKTVRMASDYCYAVEISHAFEGSRPEPTEQERAAERQADRITFSRLLRELNLKVEDFDVLVAFGLPKPISMAFSDWGRHHDSVYSRAQIKTWQRALADLNKRMCVLK